jgi:hypothetical protein
MLRYARLRGLKRRLFTLPGLPVRFMARFVDFLTPVPAAIAEPLIGGLQSDSIVLDDSTGRLFPEIGLIPYDQAVTESLAELRPAQLERVWEGLGRDKLSMKHEGFFIIYRRLQVRALPAGVYRVFAAMGGRNGWPFANWLWSLRGWLDRLVGGTLNKDSGVTTGIKEGGNLDYYRVERLEADHLLRLYSELRAPGEGWMEWRVESEPGGGSTLTQTAFFAPRGLSGFLYWALLRPLHGYVFRGLIQAIKHRSETQ